jgi:pimeloyl-ACP methyl ester carboxylesterase
VETIYRTLEDWIEQLDAPAPYHLIGHSLGGYLSIQLGLQHARKVRAMTLIDPLYSSQQIHPVLRYLSRSPDVGVKLLPYIPQNLIDAVLGWDPVTSTQFSPEARLQTIVDIKRASPQILHIPRSLADLTPRLAQVEHPCQVIWGDKDLTLSPKSFKPLVSALPHASGHVIPGTGHQPHVGVPEIVNALILDFVAKNNGPAV